MKSKILILFQFVCYTITFFALSKASKTLSGISWNTPSDVFWLKAVSVGTCLLGIISLVCCLFIVFVSDTKNKEKRSREKLNNMGYFRTYKTPSRRIGRPSGGLWKRA